LTSHKYLRQYSSGHKKKIYHQIFYDSLFDEVCNAKYSVVGGSWFRWLSRI